MSKKNKMIWASFYLVNTHAYCMRIACVLHAYCMRKMGRLSTPGGAVLGIVGGGVRVPFFKWRGYF